MEQVLEKLVKNLPLTENDSFEFFNRMMEGSDCALSDAQIGAYLFSTTARELRSAELIGGARSLRKHMVRVPLEQAFPEQKTLDTCGTGGSGLKTLNTSTAVAFVCAAAGQIVAKHGNRAASGNSGSADVLEVLGLRTDLPISGILKVAEASGFCFMFAPNHHPATKRVAILRKELGFRTVFNYLGPTANPAGVTYQLMGVSSQAMIQPIAETLHSLGLARAMVVCGEDGLDELTVNGYSQVCEIKNGELISYRLHPEDVGVKRSSLNELVVGDALESAAKIRSVLSGFESPAREIVSYNAGAALYLCSRASSIAEGVGLAKDVLDSGAAMAVLERAVETSQTLSGG